MLNVQNLYDPSSGTEKRWKIDRWRDIGDWLGQALTEGPWSLMAHVIRLSPELSVPGKRLGTLKGT